MTDAKPLTADEEREWRSGLSYNYSPRIWATLDAERARAEKATANGDEWRKVAAENCRIAEDWRMRCERAEAALERAGYRRCDIPACNCGGWHEWHNPRAEKATEAEAVRWQAGFEWLHKEYGSDGGFCDSCDPLDFTVSEARQALTKVQDERDEAVLAHDSSEACLHMAVARLGGEVEGAPTHRLNFLQRIDELRKAEAALAAAVAERDALTKSVVAAKSVLSNVAKERDAARHLLHEDGQPVTHAHEGFRDEYADLRAAAEGR